MRNQIPKLMQIKTKTDATTKLNKEIKITQDSEPSQIKKIKKIKKKKPQNQHIGLARFSTKTIEKVPTEILFIINLPPQEYNRMLIQTTRTKPKF